MRKLIAKLLFCFLWFKIRKEIERSDSILAIYGHDQKKQPFEALIKWLIKQGYHFITPQELLSFISGDLLKYKKNVWLSFDDGWKSNYTDVLLVLKKYNIPATIFIATKGVEDGYYWFDRAFQNRDSKLYNRVDELWKMPDKERKQIICELPPYIGDRKTMNAEEIKFMNDSGLISWGNHTHDHVMSDNCTEEDLIFEIDKCQNMMFKYIGEKCDFIYSYPNGNYDERSYQLVKKKGFKMAVTTELGRVFPNTDPFKIKRNEIKNVCLEENILQTFGLWTPFFDSIKRVLRIEDRK